LCYAINIHEGYLSALCDIKTIEYRRATILLFDVHIHISERYSILPYIDQIKNKTINLSTLHMKRCEIGKDNNYF